MPRLKVDEKSYHWDKGKDWDPANRLLKFFGKRNHRRHERLFIHHYLSSEEPDDVSYTIPSWRKAADRWEYD